MKKDKDLQMQGEAGKERRVRPICGWTSVWLSLGGPVASGAIRVAGPQAGLDVLVVPLLAVPILGLLAGIIGLSRREQPKFPAWVGIGVGLLFCVFLYNLSHPGSSPDFPGDL
jgi:Mn2+/Fe2+ NRAMP family transporter